MYLLDLHGYFKEKIIDENDDKIDVNLIFGGVLLAIIYKQFLFVLTYFIFYDAKKGSRLDVIFLNVGLC